MYHYRFLVSSAKASCTLSSRLTSRTLHSSTRESLTAKTKRQAPDVARAPKEDTMLDQNPHLKHASSSKEGKEGRDLGKGNAAHDPELPSQQFETPSGKTPGAARGNGVSNEKRKIHTSAVTRAQGSSSSEHTAESYFKEVDENAPSSEKTHRVDGTNESTYRPNEQWADPNKEYATMSKDEPYEPPVETNNGEKPEQRNQKPRYGATKRDAMRHAPAGDEGPQSKDAGGLKSNGRVGA